MEAYSIEIVGWTDELLERLPKSLAVTNQLDRASTSIPLNLAEGNGKSSDADRCRFFDIARGSALERAACLDALAAKKRIDCAEEGKDPARSHRMHACRAHPQRLPEPSLRRIRGIRFGNGGSLTARSDRGPRLAKYNRLGLRLGLGLGLRL